MKKWPLIIVMLAVMLAAFAGKGEAKWWIFGVSEDEVETNYLMLNRVAWNELGTKVTLYRDMLPDRVIRIQGKGTAGRNKVGSVRISLDGKDSWQDVRLSESGAFEFAFTPDLNRVYKVYLEITDTTGKTNKVDATYKELTISEINIQAVVRDALNRLIDAYQRENPAQFMALVADDFAGDKTILDRAIRKDFSAFDNISLRYTLNNVASDATGKVYVGLSFSRMVTSTQTGRSFSDKGITEFAFKVGDTGLRVYSMKVPLIFGLSDASNVATGVVNIGSNEPIIVVDSRGTVSTVPYSQAAQAILSGSTAESGQKELVTTCAGICASQAFNFVSGMVVAATGNEDITLAGQPLFFKNGTGHINLGLKGIDQVTSVPTSGYSMAPEIWDLPGNIGHSFALKLANGKYAVLYIVNFSATAPGPTQVFRLTFKYKYQPNGTPNF